VKRIESQEIPMHRGGADGVETLKSDKPLIVVWKERNSAIERVVRTRPLDFYDLHDDSTLQFDERLDLEDERERSFRWQFVWFVPREAPQFRQAEKELYLIRNLYEAACGFYTFSLKSYQTKRRQLLEAGYPLVAIEDVPSPPEPITLLHLKDGCIGEVHRGHFKGQQPFYEGKDYKRLFCTACGWVSGSEPPSSPIFASGPVTEMRMLIEDLGPVQLVPDPEIACTSYMPDFDLEPGDDTSELHKAEEEGRRVTRRCMKAHGLLLSVSEAASLLHSSTQNVSNYIAKHRLRAWPDPDDTRYRLVLRHEVEAL
jgi:hypothetical protein